MSNHTFTCILFDLDGTLVDTAPDLAGALNHVLALNNLESVPVETIRPFVGHGGQVALKKVFAMRGIDIAEDHLQQSLKLFLDHYVANITATSRPFPGAVPLIEQMHADGLRIGICTNKRQEMSELLIEQLGLTSLFHSICGSDVVANRKPHEDHIHETIRCAGGDLSKSVMVGDTKTDVDAARAAGIPVVLFSHGYTPDPVNELGADIVIDHFDDLPAALAKLSN